MDYSVSVFPFGTLIAGPVSAAAAAGDSAQFLSRHFDAVNVVRNRGRKPIHEL